MSVDKNIHKAKKFADSVKENPLGFIKKVGYLYKNYASGKEQDYKRLNHNYERFGNFNFGASASALGISENLAKIGAGLYQIRSGTSKLDYIKSFGDDPKDQYDIDKGYKYHEQKSKVKKTK